MRSRGEHERGVVFVQRPQSRVVTPGGCQKIGYINMDHTGGCHQLVFYCKITL
jgi:hypothetical protein